MTSEASIDPPQIRTARAIPVAVIRETVGMDELPAFFDRAYHAVTDAIGRQGVHPAGPPVGIYYGMPGETVDVAAGFPVSAAIVPDGDVHEILLPAGRVAETVHHGAYDQLGRSYQQFEDWMRAEGVRPSDVVWETYETMPTPEADPATMRTRLTWLLEG